MPTRYTPEEKTNALVHLQNNGGDVPFTARQLGIPERTLFTWRRQWYAENQQQQSSLPLLPINRPEFENDLEVMVYIRQQIMDELLDLAASLRDRTTPTMSNNRIHLLSHLLDRLIKLDQHLKPYRPPVQEYIGITWECGLYLRTEAGYRGPHTPQTLHKDWRTRYGPSTRLEIYWGDGSFSIIPDEGNLVETLFDVRDFRAEHCDLAPDLNDDDYEYDYDYSWDRKRD